MEVLVVTLACFSGSWLAVALVRLWVEEMGCYDMPNHRSSHSIPTPRAGGLGMVLATSVFVGLVWWKTELRHRDLILYLLSLILAVVGLLDDMFHLSRRVRFAAQLIIVLAAIFFVIPDFFMLPLIPNLPLLILVLGASIWWINVFNFMDGLDALAAMQAIFMLLAAVVLTGSSTTTDTSEWLIRRFMIFFSAIIGGFLVHNFPPAKIFMGDVGSTWLAFVLLCLALLSVSSGWLPLSVCLILPAIFITDATVTLFTRIASGQRWYEAHRNHAYQKFSRCLNGTRKYQHQKVTLFVTVINVVWLFPLALACIEWPILSYLCISAAYFPLLYLAVRLRAGRRDLNQFDSTNI